VSDTLVIQRIDRCFSALMDDGSVVPAVAHLCISDSVHMKLFQ